jgi:hypothetical protein
MVKKRLLHTATVTKARLMPVFALKDGANGLVRPGLPLRKTGKYSTAGTPADDEPQSCPAGLCCAM